MVIPLRGEIYPIDCKHYSPIVPYDLSIIEKINKTIREEDTITPPDHEIPFLKQLLGQIIPVSTYHELGNSHYHILVNKNGSVVAFFAKAKLPNVLKHILSFNEISALSLQLGGRLIEDMNENLNLKPIEFLHLEARETVVADQINLTELPFLKYLSIDIQNFEPWRIPTLPSLQFLLVNNAEVIIEPQPELRTLCIKDVQRYSVEEPEKFKRLETLSIRNSNGMDKTGWIQKLPRLRELYLQNTPINQETIEKLRVDTLSIMDCQLEHLKIPHDAQIKHLILKRCKISSVDSIPTSVISLDLSNNKLTEIPPLVGYENLQILSLEDNLINKFDNNVILPSTLKMLNIQGNPLSTVGENIQSKIKGIPVVIFPRIMIPNTKIQTEQL